jgi:hypothetical protein
MGLLPKPLLHPDLQPHQTTQLIGLQASRTGGYNGEFTADQREHRSHDRGCTNIRSGTTIGGRSPGSIPPDHVSALQEHKPQVRALLAGKDHPLAFSEQVQGQEELAELERRVKEEGYVLVWCEALEDLVAFHRDDADPTANPPGFAPYSDTELRHLFGATSLLYQRWCSGG